MIHHTCLGTVTSATIIMAVGSLQYHKRKYLISGWGQGKNSNLIHDYSFALIHYLQGFSPYEDITFVFVYHNQHTLKKPSSKNPLILT